jgi:hypothetical protein
MMHQQPRMILVEGVPFTGKSTTSEYVATQLNLNGYPAHWVPEGMLLQHYFPHALAVLDQRQTVSETMLRVEWSTFVENALAAATIFVVDSALSYAAVDPLLMEDRPVAAIHAELRHIAELCVPLQPRVIHLMGDVERLVPASIVERGAGWREQLVRQAEATPYQQARGRSGVAGATSLMHDSQLLVRAVLAHDEWPTLTLDVTAPDWAAHRRAILAFLRLDEVPVDRPALARSVLQSYVGTYAADDPERSPNVLSVGLEHDTLALHGPGTRYGTLVPVSVTRFHLQATPLNIEFVVAEGLVRRLTLHTSDGKAHGFRRA